MNLKQQKIELEKQLSVIREAESKENEKKIKALLKAVEPELKAYKSLGSFRKTGSVVMRLNYTIEMSHDLCDLGFNPDSKFPRGKADELDFGEFDGNCYVTEKEPKGYKISRFLAEDCFGNMGLAYEEIRMIDPDVKKHCDDFLKAKRKLAKKVARTAEKLELDHDAAFEAVTSRLFLK